MLYWIAGYVLFTVLVYLYLFRTAAWNPYEPRVTPDAAAPQEEWSGAPGFEAARVSRL